LFKNQDSKLIFHKIFQVLLRFFQKGFKIKKNIFYSTFKKRPENGKIAKTFCFSQTISKKSKPKTMLCLNYFGVYGGCRAPGAIKVKSTSVTDYKIEFIPGRKCSNHSSFHGEHSRILCQSGVNLI